jgi:hypothetical protein
MKGECVVLRSILAVVAGFVLTMVLSFGTDALLALALPGMVSHGQPTPTPILVLALAYVFFYSIVGGYVTAFVAGRAELKHGLVLGSIFLILGLGAVLVAILAPASVPEGEQPPLWYGVSCLVLALPGPVAGAWLRASQKRKLLAEPGKVS